MQVEFFLIKADPKKSLESLQVEMARRVADRVNIKEGVRFYDNDGVVVQAIRNLREATKALNKLRFADRSSGILTRMWERSRLNSAHTRHEIRKEQARLIAIQRLRHLARTTKEIAIERGAHEYTMAKPDELHELVEAVAKSENAWFFVFEPNDLTADKNMPVTSAM